MLDGLAYFFGELQLEPVFLGSQISRNPCVEKDIERGALTVYQRGHEASPTLIINIVYPWMGRYNLRSKTVALLHRGADARLIASVGGWGSIQGRPCQLDSKIWRERVFELCHTIGHILHEDSEKDHGVAGSSAASHAEKQLAAYYWFQHRAHSKVAIHISSSPCSDCLAYLWLLRSVLSLDFVLMVGGDPVLY